MYHESDVIYWNDLKTKLKQEYPHLTNSDLLWRDGSTRDLLMTIALKLGKTLKDLELKIENL